jgi:hypothetical protein
LHRSLLRRDVLSTELIVTNQGRQKQEGNWSSAVEES